MKKFRKEFTHTVVGYYEVEAEDEHEAQIKYDDGEYDAIDTSSDTDVDRHWEDFGEE